MDPITMALLGISGIGTLGNLIFQAYNYSESERQNQLAMGREDTAVSRRVADLKTAGLSPTLAAGSAASTMPALKREAPQMDSNIIGAYIDAMKLKNDITKTNAEVSLIDMQKKKIEADNRRMDQQFKFDEENNPLKLKKAEIEVAFSKATLNARVTEMNNKVSLQELEKANIAVDTRLKNANVTQTAFTAARIGIETDLRQMEIDVKKRSLIIDLLTKEKVLALKDLEAQYYRTDKAITYGKDLTSIIRNLTGVFGQ